MPPDAIEGRFGASRKIRVLVIDDSAIVRKILTTTIAAESDMEVVGTAPDAYVARDKVLALNPDVVTLDIEMPRMNGLTFLKKLMQFHPMPVIVISSLGVASCHETLEALRYGAVDVMAKPAGPYSVGDLRLELAAKLRAAAHSTVRPLPISEPAGSVGLKTPQAGAAGAVAVGAKSKAQRGADARTVVAIGASTGGTSAIQEVLMHLPADSPGIVITQHIPPVFSLAFAKRLDQLCALEVKEAVDGDEVVPGRALIAPGNFHMLLRRSGGGYRVEVRSGPQVCYQRPSVDVMFASVSEAAGAHAVGVLLTGMGADGAQGMLKMKQAGAFTIAQDEASSVVYGMPREAFRLGAVDRVLALSDVAAAVETAVHAADCRV
ncbi:MAG TPA: chemotaxis response regulator protein-glutamate methylesterase [Granulicella sp.]|nr:chemotaxis response regulator protein-glutamate methylesterase [Granulicella sp.]